MIGLRRARHAVGIALVAIAASCASGAPDGARRVYDAGSPSDVEQYLLARVNMARADPSGELDRVLAADDPEIEGALREFGVDLVQVRIDLADLDARPPLAWNERLASAAVRHADDMATVGFQSHVGSDGSRPGARVRDAGFGDASFTAESVLAYARGPDYAHAAFLIDWGADAPTGVIDWPSPPHRNVLLGIGDTHETLGEIGLAWVDGQADGIGPFVVVHEYADGPDVFVVGTVYLDEDADGRFDPGEGLESVRVSPDRGAWDAITSPSGGYALPVTGLVGMLTIRFSEGELAEPAEHRIEIGETNVLLDVVTGS